MTEPLHHNPVGVGTIFREWTRLGITGFGGPPAHIALLRQLCVDDRKWISSEEFENAVAATSLLPGPASTQLAIYCGWKLRGLVGGLVAGLSFIFPGLLLIIGMSSAFFLHRPPKWILGASEGAGSVVAAIAFNAAWQLAPRSWRDFTETGRWRWATYMLAGVVTGSYFTSLAIVTLVFCGVLEIFVRQSRSSSRLKPLLLSTTSHSLHIALAGGLGALALVAFKIGALSYGGGFVIVPLMQHDAVSTYHWMTASQFLAAVALGQVTPGPVVLTVSAVGYAADGLRGALLATVIAFAPSFFFVLGGARHFARLRAASAVQHFFKGAGAAVIGVIAGAAIPLATSLHHVWQLPILAASLVSFFIFRRGVVSVILGAGLLGLLLALIGLRV